MRIISGKYKGKVLKGFDIDGTRPTMDRVKESLFAMIQKDVKNTTCLDLYAGSGALGIEALSNGALSCTFVDKNKIAIDTIKENTKMIDGVNILQTDAFEIHQKVTENYNLVFLDPPYHLHLIGKTLSYLIEKKLLKEEAIIICEYEEEEFSNDNFEVIKERKYGNKWIKVLKYQEK